MKNDGLKISIFLIICCSLIRGSIVFAAPLDDVALRRPKAIPHHWEGLAGIYRKSNPVIIFEKDGKLRMMVGPDYVKELEEASRDNFVVKGHEGDPPVCFTRNAKGLAMAFSSGKVLFPREFFPSEEGELFTIEPIEPLESLREKALRAAPPQESGSFREPELVDIAAMDPTVRFDIRYATTHNFMKRAIYPSAKACLQKDVADALIKVSRRVNRYGFGLLILDAYRPWYVTKMFWDATPEELRKYVADPAKGSRHNRGATLDLTLYDLKKGRPVQMTSGYDEFGMRSSPNFPGGTSLQRWHREILRLAMEEQGFSVNPDEWWHFDHRSWEDYPIMNKSFEEIK